ncbi:hypothetical protein A4X13_0g154 [Tilletia indica]|uniref:Uncharacterized protein n=1 Tax=Tilletia indica TaxID=43049 RepID=A0A177TL07_9BASI|nr:hypothetical protein A4X13_0g154 [Tilletia indica]
MADTDSASGGGGGERGSGVKLDLEKTHYDTLIVGTGLTESILAASLSNNPAHSVLHIDSNPWYGNTSASLSLRELISWSNVAHEEGEDSTSIYAPQLRFPAFEVEGEGQDAMPSEPPAPLVSLDRHFALSLCPTLLPGAGPTIDVLIRSGVASYCTFRMLEHTFVYQPSSSSESDASDALAGLKRVPSSKEDIFKDRTISLPDKRRLMKVLTEVTSSLDGQQSQSTSTDQPFLDFLSKGQGLSTPLASALAYGVALCSSQQEPTSQALSKMRTHMRSMGKYGQGAYLVGQYGGAGELAQGYCRACAVSGGTYILGHKLRSVRREVSVDGSSQVWKADIGGNEVTADWLVLDQDHSHLAGGGESGEKDDEGFDLVLGHVVLNRPFHLPRSSSANAEEKDPLPPETALFAFPPEGGDEMTTFVLMNGEGTFSTPKGQYIYYLMTSVPRSDQRSSSEILLKVRDRVLALTEGAKEEWKPAPSSNDQQTSLPSTTPLPPILEAYHRRRIPAAASLTTSADDRLLRVPFPPSLPQASSSTTSSSSPPLPGLSTSLDTATSLAESLFWIIGGGEKARAKAEAAQNRKSRRERDEEEFAGRAVALAGVRDQKKDGENEEDEEEEEEVIWDFFPKKADRVDDDDD